MLYNVLFGVMLYYLLFGVMLYYLLFGFMLYMPFEVMLIRYSKLCSTFSQLELCFICQLEL